MLPKRNKGPPASPGEKRWDRLHSVAIWLEMSYKILTHWTWLNCKKLSPRKEIFVTQEVSDSSSARLVTWHSQRAVRIAWYCHPESKEKIVPWNQHGQAQLITLPWHQGALQLLLQATALLWECFPPLWAGADSVPQPWFSTAAATCFSPWAGLRQTKQQGPLLSLMSSTGCAMQGTGLVPVLNPQTSLILGMQMCSWLICSTSPNGMAGFELISKLPWGSTSCQKFQLKPKTHAICATSASPRLLEPNEKVRQTQGKSGIISLEVLEFYFEKGTRLVFKNIMTIFPPQEFSYSKS